MTRLRPPVLVFLAGLLSLSMAPAPAGGFPEGSPEIRLQDADGRLVPLHELLGPSRTLVVIWHPDSRPAREALIHLRQRRDDLPKDWTILAVTPAPAAGAHPFIETQGIDIPDFYDPGAALASRWGVGYVYPSLALLDAEGRILGTAQGGGAGFDATLARLVEIGSAPRRRSSGTRWILALGIALAAVLGVLLAR